MAMLFNNGTVLSFGVFDGVHLGHRAVIGRLVERARALGIEGIVITFSSHPALSLSGKAPPILTTTPRKEKLIKALGVDRVIVEDFDEKLRELLPEEFVKDILLNKFHAQEVVVGYDCAFGKDRAGNARVLKELGEKYGFVVDVVEPYKLDGEVVSSTRVRIAVSGGDLDLAQKLLGRHYSISGLVVPGKGIGHKIGHATANLQIEDVVLPPPGVYAVRVSVCRQQFDGVLNMGLQPTFPGSEFRVEVHLLNFEGTLYGQSIEVYFIKNIREERTFANVEELVDQIKKDVSLAREILAQTGFSDPS